MKEDPGNPPDWDRFYPGAAEQKPIYPRLTQRDRAIAAVFVDLSLTRLQQDECPAEPLDSLARTVVDTAVYAGMDHGQIEGRPWAAVNATRKVWAGKDATDAAPTEAP